MSAAGMTTNSALQLINKELGLHQRQFLKTDMGAPKLKLIYSKDPDNRTLKTINRVTQNLSRLNNYSKVNWSHRDLNKKLLSAPSNIGRNYDKSINKKNNENLTVTQMNSINNYDEVASGSPIQRDQRLSKLRKYYGFVHDNGSQFKTFTEIEQSVNPKSKNASNNPVNSESNTARLMNQDQKINYLLMKETKHKQTDILLQKTNGPPKKLNIFTSPFMSTYSVNSQSNFIWSDHSKPKDIGQSNVSKNGRVSSIDPINPDRVVNSPINVDFSHPKLFKKINGISEFKQMTHAFGQNPNRDYVKALERKKNFRKAKGMCSEFAKLSKSQPR
jgi:hypothetical protein